MQRTSPISFPSWLERQLQGFNRYMVRIGKRRIHVMEAGDPSGDPVLMLHGNPTWGFLYRKVAAELKGSELKGPGLKSAGLRLIMPDLLGLGFSSRIESHEHTLENHGAWIGRLIDALELSRITFVGQDWGGPIGLRALCDRPNLVHGLVILNTVIGPPKPGFKPTAFHRFARIPIISDLVFRGLGFPQVNLNIAQGDKRSITGDAARAYRYPLRKLRLNRAVLDLARMVPDTREHPSVASLETCFDFVKNFDGPAAIVWGDRDPVLGGVRRHIERSLPQAQVTRTQAGHFLQEEVPEEIANAIRYVAHTC